MIVTSIPSMTHELSSAWDQPSTTAIVLDDTHALMSLATFHALKEYSATIPSGVYEGKMWKRHDGIFDREFLAAGGKPEWMLCWFGVSTIGPGYCSNHLRRILIADGEVLA